MATQKDFPTWGRWFAEGSTSLWEHWGDYRSRNHYFLGGTIDDSIHEDLAGVTILEPGYRSFAVAPQVLGELTNVTAATTTPYGEMRTSWESGEDAFTLTLTLPVGTTADASLPVDEAHVVREGGMPAASAAGVTYLGTADGTRTGRSSGSAAPANVVGRGTGVEEYQYQIAWL